LAAEGEGDVGVVVGEIDVERVAVFFFGGDEAGDWVDLFDAHLELVIVGCCVLDCSRTHVDGVVPAVCERPFRVCVGGVFS